MAEVIGKASDIPKLSGQFQDRLKSQQFGVELNPDSSSKKTEIGKTSATIKNSIIIHKQMPDPLPPALGTLRFLPRPKFADNSATIKRPAFILKQIPEPAPSKVGSTRILQKSDFIRQSATVKKDIFFLRQFPRPRPSTIGVEDLPGGFKKEAVMNGRKNPTYDLVNGVVQVDDIKVLFNAWA